MFLPTLLASKRTIPYVSIPIIKSLQSRGICCWHDAKYFLHLLTEMAQWQTLDNFLKHASKSLWSSANSFNKSSAIYRQGPLGNLPKMPWKLFLGHLLTNSWPILLRNSRQSAKNTDKFLAISREILGHLPRMLTNPRPSAEIAKNYH